MKRLAPLSLPTLLLFAGCGARFDPIGAAPDASADGGANGPSQCESAPCLDAGTKNPDGGVTPVPDAAVEECGADVLCINVKVDTSGSAYGAAEEAKLRFAVVWTPAPNSKPGAAAEVVKSPKGGWALDKNGVLKIRESDIAKPQSEDPLACPRAKTAPYQCVDNAKIGYATIYAFEDENADNAFAYCPPTDACKWAEHEYGVALSAVFISSSGTYTQGTWPTPPNPNVTMPAWTTLFPMGAVAGVHAYSLAKTNGGDPYRPIPISGAKIGFEWTLRACALHPTDGAVCAAREVPVFE